VNVPTDSDLASQRVMQVMVAGKAYNSARSACISNGGDLLTPDTASRIAAVASAVNSSAGYNTCNAYSYKLTFRIMWCRLRSVSSPSLVVRRRRDDCRLSATELSQSPQLMSGTVYTASRDIHTVSVYVLQSSEDSSLSALFSLTVLLSYLSSGSVIFGHVNRLSSSLSIITHAHRSRCVGRVVSGICDFVCLSVCMCVRALKEK